MLVSDDGGQFAFDKRELAVLTGVMATDDERGLAALWFHPSKAQAWATDGHRAVLVERELKPPKAPADAGPVALPATTAHHAAKTAGARDLVVVDISGKRVAIDVRTPTGRGVKIESFDQIESRTVSTHAVSCRRHSGGPGSIEGFFPLHHDRGSKGAVLPVNPALLGPLVSLGKLAEPTGQVWVSLGKVTDPIMFVARADVWTVWRMLVMPLRATASDHPDHGRAPSKPARASRGRGSKAGPRAGEPKPAEPTPRVEPEPAAEPTPVPKPAAKSTGGKLRAVS